MKNGHIPERIKPYFDIVKVPVQRGIAPLDYIFEERWQCMRCLGIIKANSLGASSHLSKHMREVMARKAKP